MTYSINTLNADRAAAPPSGLGKFAHELALLGGLVLLLFGLMSMLTYAQSDAAWSTTGNGLGTRNWGGRLGAMLSDGGYFLFGFSVWWLYLAGMRAWFSSLARWLRAEPASQRDAVHFVSGRWVWLQSPPVRRLTFWLMLAALLAASVVLEWGRLYRFEVWLPDHSGGVFGQWLGPLAQRWLGFTGSALVAITVAVMAAAGVFGFSWGHWAEWLGKKLEDFWQFTIERRNAFLDMRIGKAAARTREHTGGNGWMPAATASDAGAEQPAVAASVASTVASPVSVPVAPVVAASPAPVMPVSSTLVADADKEADGADIFASSEVARPPTLSENQSGDDIPAWLAEPAPPLPSMPTVDRHVPERIEPVLHDDFDHVPVAAMPLPASVAVPVLLPDPVPVPALAPVLAPLPLPPQPAPVAVPVRVADAADESDAQLPQVSLLDGPLLHQNTVAPETLEMTSRLIEKKLKDFGVEVYVVAATPGPVITRYEIEPATGVKGSQVVNLAKDLARSLSLVSIRVIETIPGKNIMALELPNAKRQTIRLSEILGSPVYTDAKSLLTMGLGKDIGGQPVVADLAKMPHCLVAGTTGSGKSVGINAMILSLLYKASAHDVRLMLIDPKMLELSVYEGIPHLLCPVVTDMKHAANGLNWCVAEMEKRYKLMSKMGVRNLAGFNAKINDATARGELIGNPFSLTPEQPEPLDRLPHIVVVIDELADLMMVVGKKIEELIARLAQKARAAGIHLILATQRPSVDVITGLIKANIPTRLSFQVSSKIDSRTILDQMGAEALLGMGDMLYMPSGTGYPIRVHGAFVSDDEVHRVVSYLKEQGGEPNYIDGVLEGGVADGDGNGPDGDSGGGGEKDPMYDQAVEVVLKDRKSSISYVQRKLKIGYNRAARIMEDMQNAGLVGPLTSSGQRDILVPSRTD